jgi:hypothetical protein
MSMISSLIESIRGKRAAKYASVGEQYDAAVLAIARGEEVDADALAEMLDALDRSESDLQDDVEAKQRRLQASAELRRLSDVAREIPPMRSEVERLQQEINTYATPRRQKIGELSDKLRFMEADISARSYHENDLQSIGIPLALSQRKAALEQRRTALTAKRAEYDLRTSENIRSLDAVKVRIDATKQRLEQATIQYDRELVRQELTQLEERRDRLASNIQAWDSLKAEIDASRQAIDAEASEIRKLLMQP